jgi:hypothetical protein
MSYGDVASKFQDCAEFAGWPEAKTKAIIATVGHLDELPNVRTLTMLFARSADGEPSARTLGISDFRA